MSGSICARHVSQDTPSASHACSTLNARVGALRFRAARVAAACGEIGAIAVIDHDLLRPANVPRQARTPSHNGRGTDSVRPSVRRLGLRAALRPLRDRASHGSALLPPPVPHASTAYGLLGSPLRGCRHSPSAYAPEPPACLTAAPAARASGAQHQARTDYGYVMPGGLAVRSCSYGRLTGTGALWEDALWAGRCASGLRARQ
jgi:hypothetical protein